MSIDNQISIEDLEFPNCIETEITKLVVEVDLLGDGSGRDDGQDVGDEQVHFLALLGLAHGQADALAVLRVAPAPVDQGRMEAVHVVVVSLQHEPYMRGWLPCPMVLSRLSYALKYALSSCMLVLQFFLAMMVFSLKITALFH